MKHDPYGGTSESNKRALVLLLYTKLFFSRCAKLRDQSGNLFRAFPMLDFQGIAPDRDLTIARGRDIKDP